jgi:hypothetical protein
MEGDQRMTDTIKDPTELLAALDRIDFGELRYQQRKAEAIREWAIRKAGIDYGPGCRVRIRKRGMPIPEHSGWYRYRECLVPGALATVRDVDFNQIRGHWSVGIVLDREWSVSEVPGRPVRRYWKGTAATTPGGFEPPSAHTQRTRPEGDHGLFYVRATVLRHVKGAGCCDDPDR